MIDDDTKILKEIRNNITAGLFIIIVMLAFLCLVGCDVFLQLNPTL